MLTQHFSLQEILLQLATPLADGQYVPDWAARAAQLSAISDYYTIRLRDNPFSMEQGTPLSYASRSILRNQLHTALPRAVMEDRVGYSFVQASHQGAGLANNIFSKVFYQVDSVEKMAMSACAHALCRLSPPVAVSLALSNILYDEALHLMAISVLLNIEQSKESWITEKRATAWKLISGTHDIISYVFLEHCLYEGEGCVAAAYGSFLLSTQENDYASYLVAKQIYHEETNHALTGYYLLKLLETNALKNEALYALMRQFIATEPLDGIDSFKGRKRRFSLFVAREYCLTRSLACVQSIICRNVKSVAESGRLLVSDTELMQAETELFG